MQAPIITPGMRPATKLLPEKPSGDGSDDPPGIPEPSTVLEVCDDAAGSKEVVVVSSELDVVIEIDGCDEAVMVDAGKVDEAAVDIETAHTPS
jgi:hypothetical protein